MRPSCFFSLSLAFAVGVFSSVHAIARDLSPDKIEKALDIAPPGKSPHRSDLTGAMRLLHIPAVSIALVDRGRLRWAKAWGAAKPHTLFQAGSLSKTVTAVSVLSLVDQGATTLDRSVNEDQALWKAPENELTKGHPVTLRWLLSMRGGVDVPGYPGYVPGAPIPDLVQILGGLPPASSPPVRVVDVPGRTYAYSGGGYEIVQAVIEARTGKTFNTAVRELVLAPAKMNQTFFLQPPPVSSSFNLAHGHLDSGAEVQGGWRIVPELAAGGMWSTPSDLARLLISLSRAFRGDPSTVISHSSAVGMMTPQGGGPDGLGGAVAGKGDNLVFMKLGQNIGYQSYMLIFPNTGQGIVVMTNSDNGTVLAKGVIRRAAKVYGWPSLGELGI